MSDVFGPWKWVKRLTWYELEDANGKTVIDDGSAAGEYSPTILPNSANGRLIEAAPDLLKAAKALAACDFGANGWCNEAESAAMRLRAAIAKATGE